MVDIEILGELEEAIGQEATRRILNVFLDELDGQFAEIAACTQADQSNRIADIAHALKSTSATFGATELTGLALRIETVARNGEVDQLPDLIDSLQECIQSTLPLYRPYTDLESEPCHPNCPGHLS